MGRIVDCLKDNFNVAHDAEITIEANPATLSDEKMERYLRKGINRLSIGVQSLDNDMLDVLGRIRDENDAFYAFSESQEGGLRQYRPGSDVRDTGADHENVERILR